MRTLRNRGRALVKTEQIAEIKANKVVCDLPTNPGLSGTMDTEMMLRLGTLSAVDKDYRNIMGVDR